MLKRQEISGWRKNLCGNSYPSAKSQPKKRRPAIAGRLDNVSSWPGDWISNPFRPCRRRRRLLARATLSSQAAR